MSDYQMQRHIFAGEVWDGTALRPAVWDLLLQKDLLLELTAGQPPYQIILGAPHHAAPGVKQIAEKWLHPRRGKPGRSADENTGLIALATLRACGELEIPTRLVIAVHPTDHDPNKTSHSPYWRSVLGQPAYESTVPLLFELHGAGDRHVHDLELSAGRNALGQPLAFGAALAEHLPAEWKLASQTHPGTRQGWLFSPTPGPAKLDNPALETGILKDAGLLGMPALHLEMKTFFRRPDPDFPDSPRPSQAAWLLAHALAQVFKSQAR